MKWIDGNKQLPTPAGKKVCVRYNGTYYEGYRNFDSVHPAIYIETPSGSATVRNCEWLDESTAPVAEGVEVRDLKNRIEEVINEHEGMLWESCTGCHETVDGQETGHYPYSEVYKCYLGSGCHECGGIGAVWNDYSRFPEYAASSQTIAEYQLCPKCNGTGSLQPPYEINHSGAITTLCNMCNTSGKIVRPNVIGEGEQLYRSLLESVKIALTYRDFGVLNEYLHTHGENKIPSPVPAPSSSAFGNGLLLDLDNPWPTKDVLQKLIDATKILLHKKDYDGPNYEEMEICVKRAEALVEALNGSGGEDQEALWNEVIFIIGGDVKIPHQDEQDIVTLKKNYHISRK